MSERKFKQKEIEPLGLEFILKIATWVLTSIPEAIPTRPLELLFCMYLILEFSKALK